MPLPNESESPVAPWSNGRVINIGVRREHVEERAQALRNAGYEVQNAFSMAEMEGCLRNGRADVLVIGHNVSNEEKRHVLDRLKATGLQCSVVEMYMYVPELMAATAHVRWDEVSNGLVEAVKRAASEARRRSSESRVPELR